MTKITLKVAGMQCGMCEAHVNNAVRNAFNVKKVTSSHIKGQTIIISQEDIDEQALKNVISGMGYDVTGVEKEPYEKKGLFSGKK